MLNAIKIHLTTPLFTLYKVNSIEDIKLNETTAERIKNIFNLERRKDIYNSLKWAQLNPDFQFESVMKNTPTVGSLNFSNEEIFNHLMNYKSFMENQEYNLLTDDREPISF